MNYKEYTHLLKSYVSDISVSYIIIRDLFVYFPERIEETLSLIVNDFQTIISFNDKCLALLLKDHIPLLEKLYYKNPESSFQILQLLLGMFYLLNDEKIFDLITKLTFNSDLKDEDILKILERLYNEEFNLIYYDKINIIDVLKKIKDKKNNVYLFLNSLSHIIKPKDVSIIDDEYFSYINENNENNDKDVDIYYNSHIFFMNKALLKSQLNYDLKALKQKFVISNDTLVSLEKLFNLMSEIKDMDIKLDEETSNNLKAKIHKIVNETFNLVIKEINALTDNNYYLWFGNFYFNYKISISTFTKDKIIKKFFYYNNDYINFIELLFKYSFIICENILPHKSDNKTISLSLGFKEADSLMKYVINYHIKENNKFYEKFWCDYFMKNYTKEQINDLVFDYLSKLNMEDTDDVLNYLIVIKNFVKLFNIKLPPKHINMFSLNQVDKIVSQGDYYEYKAYIEEYLIYCLKHNLIDKINDIVIYMIKKCYHFDYLNYIIYVNIDEITPVLLENYDEIFNYLPDIVIVFTLFSKNNNLLKKLEEKAELTNSVIYKNFIFYYKLLKSDIKYDMKNNYYELLYERYYYYIINNKKIELLLHCVNCNKYYIKTFSTLYEALETFRINSIVQCIHCGKFFNESIDLPGFLNIYNFSLIWYTRKKMLENKKYRQYFAGIYTEFPFIGFIKNMDDYKSKSSLFQFSDKKVLLDIYYTLYLNKYFVIEKFFSNHIDKDFLELFYALGIYHHFNKNNDKFIKVMDAFYEKFINNKIVFYGKETSLYDVIKQDFSYILNEYLKQTNKKADNTLCFCGSTFKYKNCCHARYVTKQ